MTNTPIGKKILVADDNEEIRQILEILLTGEGYQVIMAEDGVQAVELVDDTVDLCILDVNMPFKSGFIACSEIRKKTLAPILFLTAYALDSDKAMGFSAGGDDYLSKPFSNGEVLLRVKALLRRYTQYQPHRKPELSSIITIRGLQINTENQSVTVDGTPKQLTATEYRILELLAANRKKVFSIDLLYTRIWEGEGYAVGDNAVMAHIKNLRKKIEEDSRNPEYIKTAWGRGYYFD